MDIPETLSAAFLADSGPTAVLAAIEAAKPRPSGVVDAPSLLYRGAWQARANMATQEVRAWSHGKGAVGRWAAAQAEADAIGADGGRGDYRRALTAANELKPAAESEWSEARAALAEYFADASRETGESAQPSGRTPVGKW